MKRIWIASNIKTDWSHYLRDRTVSKSCYKKNRRRNNNNNLTQNQQPKIDTISNYSNFWALIKRFSKCGKTYLLNCTLLWKQEPSFINTKSMSQYFIIKPQTSDENQPFKNYEVNTVVFDDRLLSKQAINFDLFFTRRRRKNFDSYYLSQNYLHFPKTTNLYK